VDFFITSCGNHGSGDDTNPATTVNGTDTALPVNPDSLSADQTRLPPPVDTSNSGMMAKPDTAAAGSKMDTASKAEPGKSGKKVK